MNGPIELVTFDLDDTLWDIWPTIARAECRLHDWLDANYPAITERFSTLDLRQLCTEIARDNPALAHDRTHLRKAALARAADLCGYAEFDVEPAFEVFFEARNEVIFFEEVKPVLERLAVRFRLGALSNGNADIQRVGLGHLFDFSINAIDIGQPKPHRSMFEAACRHCRITPENIVHVGDDPEHDVLGAAAAGYRTVWVNRHGQPWPGGPPADAEVRTLEELEIRLYGWTDEPSTQQDTVLGGGSST
jgi:putative hydrolase of the HAD superfamily